jgi:hypothetical protein
MHTPWTTSAAALPHEGQHVEFLLDGRDVAMEGAYALHVFRTRWTGYDVLRVRTWRCADSNPHVELSTDGEAHAAQPALADLPTGQTPSAALHAGAPNARTESLAA